MKHLISSILVLGFLGACAPTDEPVGGRGPFDPPPPEKVDSPLFARPNENLSSNPFPQTPRNGLPATDPETQLVDDVAAALRETAPGTLQPRTASTFPAGTSGATGQALNADGTPVDPLSTDIGIDPNDQSINLSLSSQEQQKRERDAAAARRAAAQQQLQVIEPESVPRQDLNANVVRFARETTHPVGTRIYNRPAFRDRSQSASVCRRFESADESQRQFLANGGPSTDRFNLDPDGDGFACEFDPESYRKLNF